MAAHREALHALAAACAAKDRTVQDRRQVLQAYRAATGAESVRLEVLPAWPVDDLATGYAAGAASAAVTQEQVCSAAPAEPVV